MDGKMKPTKAYQIIQKQFELIVGQFEHENPDLYVDSVRFDHAVDCVGRRIFFRSVPTISVQPHIGYRKSKRRLLR